MDHDTRKQKDNRHLRYTDEAAGSDALASSHRADSWRRRLTPAACRYPFRKQTSRLQWRRKGIPIPLMNIVVPI